MNLGRAYVDVAAREGAMRLMRAFQGHAKWMFENPKVFEVSCVDFGLGVGTRGMCLLLTVRTGTSVKPRIIWTLQ